MLIGVFDHESKNIGQWLTLEFKLKEVFLLTLVLLKFFVMCLDLGQQSSVFLSSQSVYMPLFEGILFVRYLEGS